MPDSKPIRILHVVRTLDAGGLEIGLINLVDALQGEGFEQAVCCLETKGALAENLPEGIPVLSCRSNPPSVWKRHELTAVSVFRKFRPDIIHARNYGAWIDSAFARSAALNPGRLAFTIHGWNGTERMPRRRAFTCRMLSAVTTGMAAVSEETARDFADETGIKGSRFHILHSGIDTNRFCPRPSHLFFKRDDEKYVIGCVARLDPVKDHRSLIEAFAKLTSRMSRQVELRLIGDGPMRIMLEQQVHNLGLTQSVRFLGTRDDLPQQLRELDLFVLPSLREGRPTSIMEAMAVGLPVVATRVGSVADLVDDQFTGRLLEPQNPTALAGVIEMLLLRDDLCYQMGTSARAKAVAEFSLDRMKNDYANFYREIARRDTHGRPLPQKG